MNVAKVESDKKVLVSLVRGNRKASGQIRRRPFGTMDGSDLTGGKRKVGETSGTTNRGRQLSKR
jgi:hypothetical protein